MNTFDKFLEKEFDNKNEFNKNIVLEASKKKRLLLLPLKNSNF